MSSHKYKNKNTNKHEEPAIWPKELWSAPYWVIDLLPAQVPAQSEGQFFRVEGMFLSGKHHARLRQSFADMLAKLNCYYDFQVYRASKDKTVKNPKPEKLYKWVAGNEEHLCILVGAVGTAMVEVPTDSTCMTLYGPTPELLELVSHIASASGLFVWQPQTV